MSGGRVTHGFQLLTAHDQKQEMVLQPHPLSHKEYVTLGDDKKGKVLGTGVVKVNDHFTLNDVALVDRLRYNMPSVSQIVDADLYVFF
jgi:hypothetical protein